MKAHLNADEALKGFMRSAIALAQKGLGFTNPNPLVGAVIVKDGAIIAQGFHHKYGDLHAERDALRDAKEKGVDVNGATMFVTLEPCSHTGKQPPCTQAIVDSKIKKVYIGSRDPNPLVHGKGVAFLREHGIEVIEDFLREECDALNEIFFHYITTKTPFVALKYAMTADGKIATKTGQAKWISCQKSREFSHALRKKYSCILCGIGTVLSDDPLLTCRIEGGRNPVRIICDSSLRIPLESKIVQTAKEVRTIVACGDASQNEFKNQKAFLARETALKERGIEVLHCSSPSAPATVDIKVLMGRLGQMGLDSVLVEGGSQINYSMLKAGVVKKIYSFVSPKIFGGPAPSPVGGEGIENIEDAFMLRRTLFTECGDDILIEYSLNRKEGVQCSQAL